MLDNRAPKELAVRKMSSCSLGQKASSVLPWQNVSRSLAWRTGRELEVVRLVSRLVCEQPKWPPVRVLQVFSLNSSTRFNLPFFVSHEDGKYVPVARVVYALRSHQWWDMHYISIIYYIYFHEKLRFCTWRAVHFIGVAHRKKFYLSLVQQLKRKKNHVPHFLKKFWWETGFLKIGHFMCNSL